MEVPCATAGDSVSSADLRERVFNAFANTSAPDVKEITGTSWDGDLEREGVRQAFAGRAWHELPVSLFAEHRQALFFLSPRAWAYYVPGYMLAAIDRYNEADTVLTEIAETLTPSGDADIEPLRKARLAALTQHQRCVIVRFIDWAAVEFPDDIDEHDRTRIITAVRSYINSEGSE